MGARYWRSNLLTGMVFCLDLIALSAGIFRLPILRGIFWHRGFDGSQVSLWSYPIISSDVTLCLVWTLRLAAIMKVSLILCFIFFLNIFQSYRDTLSSEGPRRSSHQILFFSIVHLIFSIFLVGVFWVFYLPTVLFPPNNGSVRMIWNWIAFLFKSRMLGIVPVIITLAVGLDTLLMVMVIYYRSKIDQWRKFNSDFMSFFNDRLRP